MSLKILLGSNNTTALVKKLAKEARKGYNFRLKHRWNFCSPGSQCFCSPQLQWRSHSSAPWPLCCLWNWLDSEFLSDVLSGAPLYPWKRSTASADVRMPPAVVGTLALLQFGYFKRGGVEAFNSGPPTSLILPISPWLPAHACSGEKTRILHKTERTISLQPWRK